MADIFRHNGYRTGHFGKWHLGDNYPFQPHNRGFDESVHHKGAAITHTPDYWNNDYFDDHYWDKDELKQYKGYCTDVWFEQAINFIDECRKEAEAFFVYLPTNCPHGPLYVPDRYREPYKHLGNSVSSFFGMIANIDENIGKLDAYLESNDLKNDTILVFMTDNGGTVGVELFNAGMRGRKGDLTEGGHRVPCFIRWPNGDLKHGDDLDQPTQVQDILPTLMGVCELSEPDGFQCDGSDLGRLLVGQESRELDERRLVVQCTRRPGIPFEGESCVIWGRWRLVNQMELFNVDDDPQQQTNVAVQNTAVVTELTKHYAQWWNSVEESIHRTNVFPIGGKETKVVNLCLYDWDDYEGEQNIYHQYSIRGGVSSHGHWQAEILQAGDYLFEMRRWPREAEASIASGLPEYHAEDDVFPEGVSLPITQASLTVQGQNRRITVNQDEDVVRVKLHLDKGEAAIDSAFYDKNGHILCGVYYLTVRALHNQTFGGSDALC
jgi:hypothetical protein